MNRTIVIARCSECPWRYSSRPLPDYCNFGELEKPLNDDVDIDHDRQPWCPLNDGPVTVQAAETQKARRQ